MKIKLLHLFVFTCFSLHAIENYEVHFVGVEDPEVIKVIEEFSDLLKLKDKAPKTEPALKRRAENDVKNIPNILQSLGYYSPTIKVDYDFEKDPPEVVVNIDPGPIYTLNEFTILPDTLCVSLEDLGVQLGQPALPADIIQAEENLIEFLAFKGYPLSIIKDRQVEADKECAKINVIIEVETGPLSHFGETTIFGNCSVQDKFFRKKIVWNEGDIYDPDKVERTLRALEASGLFCSIAINHTKRDDCTLPMKIEVSERLYRSIGFGASYSTQRGGGVTGEWENRNVRGMGEKLMFETNLLQKLQEAKLKYVKPDYLIRGQDFLWFTELKRDVTKGYTEQSFSVAAILERQLSDTTRISYGGQYKQLHTYQKLNHSKKENNTLIKAPLQYLWTNTDNTLDPTRGASLFLKITPTVQVIDKQFTYSINQLIGSGYISLDSEATFVLASKVNIGTIYGASMALIPPPEKFYAGSESTLRGYNYFTVSPLKDNDPIGGRSLFIYTAECRWHFSTTWGMVGFFDVGNVYSPSFPQFNKKMLKSLGFGVRYYTPVGPLRLDFAFPLDRRPHIDSAFQVYFSVGQAF